MKHEPQPIAHGPRTPGCAAVVTVTPRPRRVGLALLNGLTALSILLWLASVSLWLVAAVRPFRVERAVFRTGYRIMADSDGVAVFAAPIDVGRGDWVTSRQRATYVPFVALVTPTVLLPYLRLRLRRRRVAPLGCSSCAYDLTGNVSGVCPECGMPVA